MQQMHIRIVRIPTRAHLPNDVEIRAFQAVKSIGAVPLAVLTGVRDPNALVDDTRIIQDVNSVFGKSLVYYESWLGGGALWGLRDVWLPRGSLERSPNRNSTSWRNFCSSVSSRCSAFSSSSIRPLACRSSSSS